MVLDAEPRPWPMQSDLQSHCVRQEKSLDRISAFTYNDLHAEARAPEGLPVPQERPQDDHRTASPVRILHVYKDYAPVLGGIENHIRWQAEGMRVRGHDVRVLVTAPGPLTRQEQIHGVPVTKSGRQLHLSSAPISLQMPGHLRRLGREADIVHLHAPYPPGELAQLLLRVGRRTVITYHSDIVRQATLLRLYGPFLRAILRRADRILVSTPPYIWSSPFLRPLAEHCPEKLTVVHFGIDIGRFRATPGLLEQAEAWRARLGPGPLALFVGRLRYYKGVDILVDAVAQVEGLSCAIAGQGPMAQAIAARIRARGIHTRVHMLGTVPDETLPALYHAADIFVLPSVHRSESLGIVLLEAMAAGRPLISTELGTGTSYVNVHGETGLVVPPGDVDALAQALATLAGDPALRARFGRQAQARAQAEFSLERMLDQTEAVYREILVGP